MKKGDNKPIPTLYSFSVCVLYTKTGCFTYILGEDEVGFEVTVGILALGYSVSKRPVGK